MDIRPPPLLDHIHLDSPLYGGVQGEGFVTCCLSQVVVTAYPGTSGFVQVGHALLPVTSTLVVGEGEIWEGRYRPTRARVVVSRQVTLPDLTVKSRSLHPWSKERMNAV